MFSPPDHHVPVVELGVPHGLLIDQVVRLCEASPISSQSIKAQLWPRSLLALRGWIQHSIHCDTALSGQTTIVALAQSSDKTHWENQLQSRNTRNIKFFPYLAAYRPNKPFFTPLALYILPDSRIFYIWLWKT